MSKNWLDYFMEIFGLKRVEIVEKKKRGRPLGSKNKKKVVGSANLRGLTYLYKGKPINLVSSRYSPDGYLGVEKNGEVEKVNIEDITAISKEEFKE